MLFTILGLALHTKNVIIWSVNLLNDKQERVR